MGHVATNLAAATPLPTILQGYLQVVRAITSIQTPGSALTTLSGVAYAPMKENLGSRQ